MIPIAAIVLAAGRSSRMPEGKLLAPLDSVPLILHTVAAACASKADPVIVVTGYRGREVAAALAGLPVLIVENVSYADGLSSSLTCGVKIVPEHCGGFVVLLGDMPFVRPAVINGLIEGFAPAEGRAIGVPVHRGRQGNPVLWSSQFRDEILTLTGDQGAKPLMALHSDLIYLHEVPTDSVLTDFDTPEDFTRR